MRHITQMIHTLRDKLQQKESDFDAVFDQAIYGIATLDAKGAIESFNTAAEKIFGYTKEEILGEDITKLFINPPSSLENIHNEITATRKDGTTFPLEIGINTFNLEDTPKFLAFFRGISTRKKTETALLHTTISINTINLVNALFIYRQDSSIFPEIFERLLHATMSVSLSTQGAILEQGKALASSTPPPKVAPYKLTKALMHDDLLVIPLFHQNTVIATLALCNPSQGYTQSTLQALLPLLQTCTIMVDGLHIESERKKQNEAMAAARDQALAANQAKSAFLANMSHEIRTPLNGIMGMTELLLNTELSSKQSKYAQSVYQSAEVLLTLINDILDISKIEAGELKLEIIPCNLPQLIQDTITPFTLKAREKNIKVTTDISPNTPHTLFTDPLRLRQVLNNLLSNAIKFTEKGEVTLKITSTGSKHRFEVLDSGIGIPKEHQHHLFEKFSQADSSTTRKFGGTGLGLAISKELVEMMKGTIGFSSTKAKGSTFWFELPREPK